jgi:hypothetical protein
MSFSDKEPTETFWHYCLLVVILGVAACVRFYAIDLGSLTPAELTNFNFCSAHGWLNMASEYSAQTGMPPLYPTLLCNFTDLTSNTEFFMRALSGLAGLVTLYLVYITGRDMLGSPDVGLLAAAVMATNYHQAIFIDRQATHLSLLMMFFFLHSYCFARLFFSRQPCDDTAPLHLRYSGAHSRVLWQWQPDFPRPGKDVVAFWITGALLFYTSHTSLVLLITEFFASLLLAKPFATRTRSLATLLRALWLPLMIALLPWLPVVYGYKTWILTGHLFILQDTSALWQKMQLFLPIDARLLSGLIALITLNVIFAAMLLIRKNQRKTLRFIAYALVQWFAALLSLWFLQTSDYSSHLYFWWLFILILMLPVARILDSIPYAMAKNPALGITLLAIAVLQINFNADYKLYRPVDDADFRLAARIIHNDAEFMKSGRTIYTSSNLFNYYLDAYSITNSNLTPLDRNNPPDFQASDNTAAKNNASFYYLEHIPYLTDPQDTRAVASLANQYKIQCITKIKKIHVFKFSRDPHAENTPEQDCLRDSPDVVTLK